MHIDEKIKGSVAVITVSGELLFEEDDSALQQKVASLRSDGFTQMVFDLKKVNRINSRGLNALISALKTVRKGGGDIKLAQIDDHLKDVFVQTRLVQVFSTYETVGRAMASFSAAAS